MSPREFYDKVKYMRFLQKVYFKTRDAGALAKSKEAEAEIDNEIKRVEAILAGNQNQETKK